MARRGFRAALALVVVLTAAGCSARSQPSAAVSPSKSGAPSQRDVRAAPTTTLPPAPPPPPPRWAGKAAVPRVSVYDAPGSATVVRTLTNPTAEQMPLAVMVVERDGEWVKASIPVRPNGTQGWIKASDLTISDLPYRIEVRLGAHTLTLLRGNEIVLQEPVAVGTARTPTPLGNFYIDIVNPIRRPGTVWGPYQLSISAFSDVLKSFMGGIGQLAIHGTNRPALIGTNVSNGCIRMHNDAITRVAALTGVGTPVDILA